VLLRRRRRHTESVAESPSEVPDDDPVEPDESLSELDPAAD
jgi:hypothetical protein